ncbi:hypothetical protein G9F72_016690 [Clostridium estertheticum]|uniref:hypothetical protein n=1 Tax=Clostridium estertheticum TaxID=238834 RepID=UPI0013E94B81|nr:hypothetical protein [Clostridium estertheticum]MBZ9687970.1 hypothetical protein [Clostridium estertheticum]
MDDDFKKIIHAEINKPTSKNVDIKTPKPKNRDYRLMVLWVIVGLLAVLLLYYAYQMIYIYF